MLSHVIGIAFSVLAIRLISSALAPEDYGHYSMFGTLTTLAILSTHGSLYCVAVRNWELLKDQRQAFAGWLANKLLVKMLWTLPIILLATGIAHLAQPGLGWLILIPLLVVANTLVAVSDTVRALIHAERRRWTLVLTKLVESSSRAILPTAAVALMGPWFGWGAAGYAGFLFMAAIINVLMLRSGGIAQPSQEQVSAWMQKLRKYGRPYMFTGALGWLLWIIDIWLAVLFYPEKLGGLYAMAVNLCSVVVGVIGSTLLVWAFPHVYRLADAARSAADWRRLRFRVYALWGFMIVCVLAGVMVLYWVQPWVVGIIIDERYAAAWPLIFFGAASTLQRDLMQIPFLLLQGLERSGDNLRILAVLVAIKLVVVLGSISISEQAFLYGQWISLITMAVVGIFWLDSVVRRSVK